MILRKILLVQTRKFSDFSTMFQLKNLETQKQVKNSIEGLKFLKVEELKEEQKKVIEEIDILLNKISKSKKNILKNNGPVALFTTPMKDSFHRKVHVSTFDEKFDLCF